MDPLRARDEIRAGRLRGAALRAALEAVPFGQRDAWIDAALALDAPPDDEPLPRGAVPYVPCGVDAIVHALRDAPVRSDDVFVDLGCGLGRVALVAHLLTGARCVGIDLQAPLIERARRTARDLALDERATTFVVGDAAAVADTREHEQLRDGTVFFIYASFSADVLARVLDWLAQLAASRAYGGQGTKRTTLCAVGFDVHDARFVARASHSVELTLYERAR